MIIKYLILISTIFLVACANIKPPTGGEKDLDPPVMIRTIPEHNSTDFQGEEITLFFNEQIESKNLISELIISPDDNITYKEVPKKKAVTLRFKDTLRSNTTYNFNFGNSIVDITERNPSLNARLAFSTGADIDTAFIKGVAIDMFNQKPVKDVVAVLHKNNDTIDVQKHKPSYVARADENGEFILENLPQDSFQLYVIQDLNGNLLYNFNDEKIARYSTLVYPSYEDTAKQLFLAPQDTRDLTLISVRHHYNYSTVVFNKGILNYELEHDSLFTYLSDKYKQLNIYHPFSINDSILIEINVSDSGVYSLDTSIYILKNLESDTVDPELSLSVSPESGEVINMPDSIELSFSQTIDFFRYDSMLVIQNKDTFRLASPTLKKKSSKSLLFENTFNKSRKVKLTLYSGYIIGEFGDTIKSVNIEYKIPAEEEYGQVEGRVESSKGKDLILQLINTNGKVVKQQFLNPGPFIFHFVDPGTYRLRLIDDSNNNRQWDPGNHYLHIQPEQVVIFPEDILIKANWIVQDKIVTLN